ncbi:hypothetical protein PAAG_01284 [Paracoccidioides lutzii Pb01]|uniref:Uncharacterized protein n=1 Tax=Paracoccidioides lutzii (strain ATCC MYA-826 / Pb01) TaxID=502779 RepID=C1GRY9_PARBA|nr:hypothetical protein PAAG_01284 [Paracoccidioides lutzii Pb01]EEH38363.2 hypothetical protein PAAG_01284 [Paracoccidioides lutzii Pb01]
METRGWFTGFHLRQHTALAASDSTAAVLNVPALESGTSSKCRKKLARVADSSSDPSQPYFLLFRGGEKQISLECSKPALSRATVSADATVPALSPAPHAPVSYPGHTI